MDEARYGVLHCRNNGRRGRDAVPCNLQRFYGFANCFCNISRSPADPHQSRLRRASFPQGKLLYRALVCMVYRNVPGKLQKPSPPGKGDRHRRWMRRGTAFCIVGTMGAEAGTLYLATYNASTDSPIVSATFHAPPLTLISLGYAEPASPKGSFCTVLWCVWFTGTSQESSKNLPLRGRGTAIGGG